jgi:hypothetical protein
MSLDQIQDNKSSVMDAINSGIKNSSHNRVESNTLKLSTTEFFDTVA